VYSYTVLDVHQVTRTVGVIRFNGIEGGLIHLLEGGQRVRIGLRVVPVFKPPGERRGALTDIVGFVPLGSTRR
jgi:uncharacterized OB-fold protein